MKENTQLERILNKDINLSNIESVILLADSFFDLTNDGEKYCEYMDIIFHKYANNFYPINYN